MPVYTVEAPNGKKYRMSGPAGLTEQDLFAHILERDPEAGTEPPKPKTGMAASLQSGAENMWSSGKAAVKGLFGDTQAAAAEALAAQQDQAKRYDPQIGLDRLGKVYDEQGLLAAGSELIGQAGRGIAQSLPEMGGMAAGAMAGSKLGPVGGIVGGILGGVLPMTGRNLAAQQEAHPGQVSYGKAAAAGTLQAGLETVAPALLMGKRVAGKLFGDDIAELIGKLGPEAVEKVAARRLSTTVARGAAEGAAGEATTEVMQQALERLQAGQNLLDNDALKAYGEAAYGGAIAGAPLSGAGHAFDRSGAKRQVADAAQAAEQAQAERAAAEQALTQTQTAQGEEERRARPDYAAQVGNEYDAYEQQKRDMKAQIKALLSEKTDAGKAAAIELNRALKQLEVDAQPLIKEFNAVARPARAAQRAAEAYAADPMGPHPEAAGPPVPTLDEAQQARVEMLQGQIAEHEDALGPLRDQVVAAMDLGDPDAIEAAHTAVQAREKAHGAAQSALYKLAPEAFQQGPDASDEHALPRMGFDAEATQQEIDKLTALMQDAVKNKTIESAPKAVKWARRLKELQALMDESLPVREAQARDEAATTAGNLAGAAARGEVTQGWPNLDPSAHEPIGVAYGDSPVNLARETDAALGRVFPAQDVHPGAVAARGTAPGRVADPELTASVQQEADAGADTFEALPEEGVTKEGLEAAYGREQSKPARRTEVTLENEQGQGMLFTPQAGPEPTADTPRQLLRQRIDTLLAMPGLRGQARATLTNAADLLGKVHSPEALARIEGTQSDAAWAPGRMPEQPVHLSEKQLAYIGNMVTQAEKGGPAVFDERLKGTAAKVTVPARERAPVPIKPDYPYLRKPALAQRGAEHRPGGLEIEHIGDQGRDESKQDDLFDQLHVGRETPEAFQQALDDDELPSARRAIAVAKEFEGKHMAEGVLAALVKGLKARLADATKEGKRLGHRSALFAALSPSQRKAHEAMAEKRLAGAMDAAFKAQDAVDELMQKAEEASKGKGKKALMAEYNYLLHASHAEQHAKRQAARVVAYNGFLKAIRGVSLEPARKANAALHAKLTAQLASAEADLAAVKTAMPDAAQEARNATKQRAERAAAADKAAEITQRTGATQLPIQEKPVRRAEQTDAEKRQAVLEKEHPDARRVAAKENRVGITNESEAMDAAIDEARAVPGVEKEELSKITARVVKNVSAKGIHDRSGKLEKKLRPIAKRIHLLRAAHKGGMLRREVRSGYAAGLRDIRAMERAIKTASPAERAKLIQDQSDVRARLAMYDREHRVPLTNHPVFQDLQKQAALIKFEEDLLEIQRNSALKKGAETMTPAQQAAYEAAEEARITKAAEERIARSEPAKPVAVEPSTKLITDKVNPKTGLDKPATRMALDKARNTNSRYSNEHYAPTPEQKEAEAAAAAAKETQRKNAASAPKQDTPAVRAEKLAKMSSFEAMQYLAAEQLKAPAKVTKAAKPTKATSEVERIAEEAAAAEEAAQEAAKAKREQTATAKREKQLGAAIEKATAANVVPLDPEGRAALAQAQRHQKATGATTEQRAAREAPKTETKQAALARATWEQQEEVKRQKLRKELGLPPELEGLYDPATFTPLSAPAMQHVNDGNLGEALDSLAKTGSTPLVRELAAKLKPLAWRMQVDVDARVHNKGEPVAGMYNWESNKVILHPLQLSEETLLHEVVHGVTLRVLGMPDSALTREQINARNALKELLTNIQKDPAFKREYGGANIAELLSELMTNQNLRDKIDAQKPGFFGRLMRAVMQMLGLKPSAAAMKQVEVLFQPARKFTKEEIAATSAALGTDATPSVMRGAATATPALDRFGKSVTAAPRPGGIAGAKSFLKDANAGMTAEYAGVDMRVPLVSALKKGDPTQFMQGHYFIRMNDQRMSMVGTSLQQGTLGLKKDKTGKYTIEATGKTSGKDVFNAIGKLPGATPEAKFALAQAYMVAQRAANPKIGWDKLGWDTTEQFRREGEAALREANANPALKAKLDEVRKVYNDYNKGMIQFAVEAGAISKAEGARLLADGDYVPFYRVRPDGVAELALGENTHIRIGDMRRQPYLQELKGDDTKLLPLQDAIMRNTMLLTDLGLRNLATKSSAYAFQDMGKGRGPIDKKTGKPTNLNAIHKSSDRSPPAGPDIIKFKQEPDPNDPKDQANGGERWMRVTSAGTAFEGIPAEMLVQSLEGTHAVLTGMSKIAGAFGNALRSGVTRTPAYILRQLIRDPMSAAFTAGLNRGPLAATIQSMREFVSMSRGTSKTGDELLRKGITQSGIFNGTAEDMGKIALQLAGGEQAAYKKVFAAMDRAAMRADAATRAQVYEDVLQKTGSEMEAALAAIEMMNFTKRGAHPAVQYATRMIPFMNAQIQALNVLAKAFRGNASTEEKMQIKAKFIKNAAGLFGFSLLYALGMEDDEDYKNASAHERYNNFFIPNPFGHALKIPIPYEVGFLFKVLPEMMVRGMKGKFDDTDWEAFRSSTLGMVPGGTSLGMPQMIAPVVRSLANMDAFGNPIESAGQQHLAKSERSNDNTPEIAKAISSFMSAVLPESMVLSGPKIKALADSYVGGMPMALLGMVDQFLPDSNKPERMASQNPIWGSFVAKDVGTGPVASAFKTLNGIDAVNNTLAYLRDEDPDKAEAYDRANAGAVDSKSLAASFKQQLKGLKEQEKDIREDRAMLAADKREALNKVARLRNELAREFTQEAKSMRETATSP